MKKAKYKGKNVYWNETNKRWCYMNHRPIPKDSLIDAPEDGGMTLSTRLVKFFKGE